MQHDVWIPAVHRDLTDGVESVQLAGDTVGEIIDQLDQQYPGIKGRLCENTVDGRCKVRPHIAVAINGVIAHRGTRQRLKKPSEIHFIPAMSGG